MEITVKQAVLLKAVQHLATVIDRKTALPILGTILFDVRDNGLRLTASDSEVTLQTEVKTEKIEGGDGSFCVDATKLLSAISQLTDQPLTITATIGTTNVVTIKHETGDAYFPCDHADEYPLPITNELPEEIDIKGVIMTEAIKRSLWATANDELRPIMGNICFKLTDGNIDIVASDGRALVKSKYYNECSDTSRCGTFLIPRKVASILQGSLGSDTNVNIKWNNRTVQMTFTDTSYTLHTLTYVMLEGKYPNYDSVIPEDLPCTASVDRARLIQALRAVTPFGEDKSLLVKFIFSQDKLTISAQDEILETGANDTIPIDFNIDEDITIGLNGVTMIKLLSKIDDISVDINLESEHKAVTFEPTNPFDDCEVIMLLMPMLIN